MHAMLHRYNRLRELGLHNSAIIVKHAINQKLFSARWRKKAVAGKAHHTWPAIAQKHGITKNFAEYCNRIKQKQLTSIAYDAAYITQADAYARNQFDLLGSGIHTFASIPWHTDFRLQRQNPNADCDFDNRSFYKDIIIITAQSHEIAKDIKVPWELSRFQHAPILGIVYEQIHNELYAQTFVAHSTDWLDKNPYLIGINWLCPMEVALRAINWIWAWNYFKHSTAISLQFWERFICSLYDHMHYLENNWEIFDTKTSNHYLADLVGYLYLCWFFQDLPGVEKKKTWCVEELLKEFDRQVAPDGTDYESSTAYHCLVTELFDHMALLCAHMNITLPDSFHEKHARMHEFIEWCKVNDKEMVKIGDDDSGKIMLIPPSFVTFFVDTKNTQDERKKISPSQDHSLLSNKSSNILSNSEQLTHLCDNQTIQVAHPECFCESKNVTKDHKNIKHFPNFGISIAKTNTWHITLRHHAYQKQQPTAHFHNDFLSVTLAVNGIPVIIDPGSYLYTASPAWRNHFRSAGVHNTISIKDHEPIPFDNRLFALAVPENSPYVLRQSSETTGEKIIFPSSLSLVEGSTEPTRFSSSHTLYARFGITLQRTVEWDDQQIIIADSWNKVDRELTLAWNFTLHPAITVMQENNQWILAHNNKPLLALQSALNFQPHQTWVSPEYGVKMESMCLKVGYLGTSGNESKISFIKL